MYINSCIIIVPELIFTLVLKIQRVSLLGNTGNISVLGGKDSSTKERIHDGTTWEKKRSSLHHSG